MEIAQYYDLVIVSINISFHISVNCNDVGGQRLASQHFFSGQKTDWTGLVYDAPTICWGGGGRGEGGRRQTLLLCSINRKLPFLGGFVLNSIFIYDYPSSPPPSKWSRSCANKQIDRNEQNAFQVLGWMLPSVSVSWMAELGKFINCQSQFSDVSTISSLQPHNYVPPHASSSPPCLKAIILTTSLYLYLYICLFASDIYELLNGAFQIVPDQLPAWHSLFHSLKMLHFNSALLYVIAINHGILSLNMYWIFKIYSKTSPFVNQMGLFRLKTLTLIHLYFLFQNIL